MSSYTGPDQVIPISISCACIVVASSIYCLVTSRKNPGNLGHATQMQILVLLLVTAIGFALHFIGRYAILLAEGNTNENKYFEVINEVALENAIVEKHGIWFALIVAVGSFSGALALIMKKPNKPAHTTAGNVPN